MDSILLHTGEEKEFFPEECKGILLDVLRDALNDCKEGTRRYDILKSVLDANSCKYSPDAAGAALKNDLKSLKKIDPEKIGHNFKYVSGKKHCKFDYFGDPRYRVTVPKTPSDMRSIENIVHEMIKIAF